MVVRHALLSRFTLTPRLQRRLVSIDMTRGFLQAVRMRED